jgi:tetratricopeptide (TPR) repeat protein
MVMKLQLADLISRVEELAKSHEDDHAMSLANELVQQYPNETRVWSLRAYLHERSCDFDHAVTDLTRAIDINASEPHFFYSRGRYNFSLGNHLSAIDDFSEALALCDRHNSDYYREELHFWRAEALLKRGMKTEALSDLACVPDEFRSWTYKLRTKADILADCQEI